MQRPSSVGAFQFVILASLRAAQLMRGCRPRVDGGHKNTVTAQLEVSQGKVTQDLEPLREATGGQATRGIVPIVHEPAPVLVP